MWFAELLSSTKIKVEIGTHSKVTIHTKGDTLTDFLQQKSISVFIIVIVIVEISYSYAIPLSTFLIKESVI